MNEPNAKIMDHFLRLAVRGKPNTGASGGELRARRLALAIVENVPGLDDEAVAGAIEFVLLTNRSPGAAADLIGRE